MHLAEKGSGGEPERKRKTVKSGDSVRTFPCVRCKTGKVGRVSKKVVGDGCYWSRLATPSSRNSFASRRRTGSRGLLPIGCQVSHVPEKPILSCLQATSPETPHLFLCTFPLPANALNKSRNSCGIPSTSNLKNFFRP